MTPGAPGVPAAPSAGGSERLLRRGIVGLAALGIAGTALELAFLAHWDGPLQLLAWVALGTLGVALLALPRTRTSRTIRAVRGAALLGAAIGLAGVAIHVNANLESAPLDATVGPTWSARPLIEQLWMAATGAVGPAPTLAPAALVQTALALLLSTVRTGA